MVKNSSSVNTAGHFHGTGVSVLQFLSEESPRIQHNQKTFKELESVVSQSCKFLKTLTTVNKISDKREFHYGVETVNVLEKVSKCNLDKLKLCEFTNEERWLTSLL